MSNAVRWFLGLVLIASAVAKASDLDGAVLALEGVVGPLPFADLAVGSLVLLEFAVGGWLILHQAASSILGAGALFTVFLAVSTWAWAIGAESCGCFGAVLTMAPEVTVLKNAVTLALLAFVWRSERHCKLEAAVGRASGAIYGGPLTKTGT